MQNALNPSWWQPAAMRPLDAVRVTAECLEQGDAVPSPAAAIVARALRQYLAGSSDITRNLGLRPRSGGAHELPLRLEQATHRDQLIKRIYEAVPGGSQQARAEQVVQLLRKPPGRAIDESDVIKNLLELFENHADTLPTSPRQVTRIIKGETLAGRNA